MKYTAIKSCVICAIFLNAGSFLTAKGSAKTGIKKGSVPAKKNIKYTAAEKAEPDCEQRKSVAQYGGQI